jgi:hypothetical protein
MPRFSHCKRRECATAAPSTRAHTRLLAQFPGYGMLPEWFVGQIPKEVVHSVVLEEHQAITISPPIVGSAGDAVAFGCVCLGSLTSDDGVEADAGDTLGSLDSQTGAQTVFTARTKTLVMVISSADMLRMLRVRDDARSSKL